MPGPARAACRSDDDLDQGGASDFDNCVDEAATNVQLAGHEVLHVCSGPDRPGSYRRWMQSLGGACHAYDILVDPTCNLLDTAAWSVLSTDVESQRYHGMQADPVRTTFSAIRGKANGSPPVRGMGGDIRFQRPRS